MKKKLIAVALILLIAVGGVFAADINNSATALLKATMGSFLQHGFSVDNVDFIDSITVNNAFATPPEFTYGYETNMIGLMTFKMTVGNFINQSNNDETVGINKVESLDGEIAQSLTKETDGSYILFSPTGDGSTISSFVKLRVTANDYSNAAQGTYQSTVAVSIDGP